jgi:hypothetical protein
LSQPEVAQNAAASDMCEVSRSLIRTANLHRWLTLIAGDLRWETPLLCDALLETYYWVVGPMIAIDPRRLSANND